MSSGTAEADVLWSGEVIDPQERAALSEHARQRSQTYWWLADFYLAAIDDAKIAEVRARSKESLEGSEELPLKAALAEFAKTLEVANAEQLAIEHARLFGGLGESYGAIPPYESLHVGGGARDDLVVSVTDAYRDAGFERIDVPAVPQDHLAVELRFMALLCAQESSAWTETDSERLPALLARERAFLDQHLLRWVPGYADYVGGEARDPHFAALARLTHDALALDRRNVDDLVRAVAAA